MVTGLVVLVLAAAGVSAYAVVSTSGTTYRVATAGYGDVEQTLDLTGTIQPVDEATLAFQVAGQVESVDVSQGQSVSAGQVLASIDASSLQATVTQDQSTLSADQSKLVSDEQSETSKSSATSDPSTDPDPTGSTGDTGSGSSGGSSESGLTSQISAAQQQLVSDQHMVDTDLTQEANDLQIANSDCGSSGSSSSPGGSSASGGSSGSGSSSSPGSSSSGSSGTGSGSSSCTAALVEVEADQQQASSDLAAVSQEEAAISKLLSQDESSLQSSNASSSSDHTGNPSSTSGTTTSSSVATAANIASDQAGIDSEQAALDEAEQSLAEAQLTSPVSGVVAALNMTVGQTISAGSSSADIVVQGPQSFEVTGDIDVSDVGTVKVDDPASVIPDGSEQTLAGAVSTISMPTSSSGDYGVTVTLPTGAQGLYNGANAEESIVTGQASNVLTVPTSAVHARGDGYYVEVLRNGTATLDVVQVGGVGDELTQITSGLSAGASVILADLSEPLPTSSSSSTGRGIISLEGGGGAFQFRGGAEGGAVSFNPAG